MKTKFQISLFFFLLVKVCAKAQTFNKLEIIDNDYFTTTVGFDAYVDADSGYVYSLFGGIHIDSIIYQGVGVTQHDANGELMNFTYHFDSLYTATSRNLILLNDTFYYFDVEVSSRKAYLNKRDKGLLTHQRFLINTTKRIIPRPDIYFSNNKLLMVGSSNDNFTDYKGLVLELDFKGTILQEINYATSKMEYFEGLVNDTLRKSHFIGGIHGDPDDRNETNYGGPFVLEYDYSWNLKNRWNIPTDFQVIGRTRLALTDTSILISAAHGTGFNKTAYDYQMPAIYELDFNGNIIWEFKETHGSMYNSFGMVDLHLAADGFLYALAFHETYFDTTLHENWPVTYFDVTKQAVLYKWNAQRELVYTRHIKHWSTASFMSDSEPIRFHVYPDGSVLFIGVVNPDFGSGEIFKRQMWFVRTDTNGCVAGEPCIEGRLLNAPLVESKSAIPEQILYPNPSYHGWLKSKIATQEGDFAEVYTISGQKIATVLFQNSSIQLPSHIANGYYIIKMNLKDQIHATKIMLQR